MPELPEGVKKIVDEQVQMATNRRFFWLDYFDTYLLEQHIKTSKMNKRSLIFMIIQGLSFVFAIITLETSLLPLFASLLWTFTIALVVNHFWCQSKIKRIEKLMKVFGEEVSRIDRR